jgi:hypothetical protein
MLFGFGIAILLGHAEIHNVDHILFCRTASHQKVVGFNVAVD